MKNIKCQRPCLTIFYNTERRVDNKYNMKPLISDKLMGVSKFVKSQGPNLSQENCGNEQKPKITILQRLTSWCWTVCYLQAAASALEAKVALLDANHIEHIDARLQVGAMLRF